MNPLQRFRGTDAARLDDLADRANIASQALTRSAAIIGAASDDGADGAASAPPALDDLRAWLDRVAADARRRAELTRQAQPTPASGPPMDQYASRLGPPPIPAPVSPSPPRLVRRERTAPVLRRDGATGWHLQGYLGPGLSWRHLGTEHRTTTSVYDHGGGWTVQVITEEHRPVFEVELGAGFGPKRFGGLGDIRHHDRWHDGPTRREYFHQGEVVSRGQFEAAVGPKLAAGE